MGLTGCILIPEATQTLHRLLRTKHTKRRKLLGWGPWGLITDCFHPSLPLSPLLTQVALIVPHHSLPLGTIYLYAVFYSLNHFLP